MGIIPILILHAAAVVAYLAYFHRRRQAVVVVAAVLHALTLVGHMLSSLQAGLGVVLSLFIFTTVVAGWRQLRFDALRGALAAAAAVAVLMPLLLPPSPSSPLFSFHAVLALGAYAMSSLAVLQWLDLWLAERLLRHSPGVTIQPPLLHGERRCFYYVAAAFALLTLVLASGALASADGFTFTHKNLFAVLTWLTFLCLLVGRYFYGWRGRKAQAWFFAGCVFLLLSYVGSAFVLQVILNRY